MPKTIDASNGALSLALRRAIQMAQAMSDPEWAAQLLQVKAEWLRSCRGLAPSRRQENEAAKQPKEKAA